jgi:TRAP-type mannitol/chloroaromatic compound transport system substrate-binding protein
MGVNIVAESASTLTEGRLLVRLQAGGNLVRATSMTDAVDTGRNKHQSAILRGQEEG